MADDAAVHEAGSAAGYGPAPLPRSRAASAVGVLGVVFGVLVALQQASCLVIYGVAQQRQPASHALEPGLIRLVKVDMGLKGVTLLLAVALIAIGLGLWRHRETARKAMVAWSLLALVVVAGRTAAEVLVIQPETVRHQRALLEKAGEDPRVTEESLKTTARVSIAMVPVVFAPFPLVALALVTRRSVRDRCS